MIPVKEGNIVTSTFFKQTDRNGYIPLDFFHHHSWLTVVPKGQFLRLKHNCTNLEDYFKEASVVRKKIIAKGYDRKVLNSLIVEIISREAIYWLINRPGGATQRILVWLFSEHTLVNLGSQENQQEVLASH